MVSIRQDNFKGSLNKNKAAHLISDNESPNLQNIRLENDIVSRRNGCQRVNTEAVGSSITWVYTTKINGAYFTLIGTADGKVKRLNGAIFVDVETGLAANKDIEGITWLDKVFYVNGADGLRQWDGTNPPDVVTAYTPTSDEENTYGTNIISELTAPTHLVVHKNRMFVSQGSFVYVSHLRNPGYFPSSQKYAIADGDGDEITREYIYRGDVVVEKSRSKYAIKGSQPIMTDPDPFRIELIHDKIGLAAPKSAYLCDNNSIGVSKKGIYMLINAATKDDRNVIPIHAKIRPIFDSIIGIEKCAAIEYKGWYWLAIPGNVVLLFDYNHIQSSPDEEERIGRWLYDVYPMQFNCFRVDQEGRLYAGADDGYLYQLDVTENDAGTPIEAFIETKELKPNGEKYCLFLSAVVEATAQGTYEQVVNSYIDTKTPTIYRMSLQGVGSIASPKYGLPLQGRKCRHKVSNVDGGRLSIEAITTNFELRTF